MGDHEDWVQPNGLLPNGLLPNVAVNLTRKLDHDRWLIAEERTAELIACIQPNKSSEERRNAVADYVQRLITKCFPCQVFTFGSVPLKTYLPDGDIDLTAFSKDQNLKDTWANDVRDILEIEEKREDAEFHVKEVQYIQAEVKIIKCLVENIVVDISFNQLGGLCTLCFLEEVDHLIDQDHLFKRSIILIKAWCYYESRILGAHHGLISTYALETLVLYIFHVFNNSFTGPLEVLYRFLEFFSNFDWGNFCVSLWGPVPINQLPDITAVPPRKDGGELLLSKPFLDACGSVYAVYPGMQENQGKPFISKHFNVIDPLRTNNNLGRSVSKGNFFRIRSAFAFGAKKLARLLECPKENLINEVNQFFMNTWERHGSRQRPDAPSPDLWHLQPPKTEPTCRSDIFRNQLAMKSRGDNEGLIEVSRASSSDGASSIHSASTGYASRAGHSSGVHHSLSQKNPSNQHISSEKSDNGLKVDYSSNGQEAVARHQFSRTRSSPELTETPIELSLRGRRTNKASELGKDHHVTTRPDNINLRKNTSSETSAPHQSLSSSDPSSLRHNSSQKSLDACAPTNLASSLNNYAHDDGNVAQQDLQQEEQDLVNLMAATRAHGLPGVVNLGSSHIPVPLQPSLLGYSQRNLGGLMPTNLPFIDPAWASGMQFPPGIVSSQLAHYFSGLGLASSQEIIDSSNESSALTGSNQYDNDAACWSDNDNASASGLDFASSRAGGSSSTSTRSQQQKFHNGRGAEIYVSEKSANIRSSGNEVNMSKLPRSSRDKWGTKRAVGGFPTAQDKSKASWQYENDASAMEVEVDNKDWRGSSSSNGAAASAVPAGLPVGYEAGTSGSEPMIPGPMLVGSGSRQITFYPTGPPVPFVTMLPIYNFAPDVGNPSESPRQFDRDEGSLENGHINVSEHGVAASENPERSEVFVGCSSVEATTAETRDELKWDILNSDFTSHWQNLQYGRICQSPRNYPPLVYSPQFVVRPAYLQGRFPWEGPGRPLSAANMGLVSQIMSGGPRLVPVAPLQSSSGRPARVYQRYGEELPRYRSGTGTYIPNPKPIQLRDRQSANSRSHRGSYNYERNEHRENDRVWNLNSKPRGPGRSHNKYDSRTQADKLGSRSDHRGRSWDSYRHDNATSLPTQNGLLTPTSSVHGTSNLSYGVYPLQAVNSNGAVVMLYPYEHGVGYTQEQDQLEFGSLGPVPFSSSNDASQVDGGTPRLYEQQHGLFVSGSPSRSSPDQPSLPQLQRRI